MAITATAGGGVPGWRLALWGAVAALLLAPAAAMRFTDEVTRTAFDFAAAALLLGGAALAFEVAMRVLRSPRRRAVAGGAILIVLTLAWLQGAVGLIGGGV